MEGYVGKPSISNETIGQNSNIDRDKEIYSFTDNPKANGGEFQHIEVGDSLLLDGTNSSTLGSTIVSWDWLLEHHGDSFLNKKATGATATITGLTAGIYTITLTVTDNNGETDTDTVLLKVSDSSQPLSPPSNLHEE